MYMFIYVYIYTYTYAYIASVFLTCALTSFTLQEAGAPLKHLVLSAPFTSLADMAAQMLSILKVPSMKSHRCFRGPF